MTSTYLSTIGTSRVYAGAHCDDGRCRNHADHLHVRRTDRRARRAHLHAQERSSREPEIFTMFGFLYAGYKPKYFWWESVVLLRKVAATVIALAPIGLQLQAISAASAAGRLHCDPASRASVQERATQRAGLLGDELDRAEAALRAGVPPRLTNASGHACIAAAASVSCRGSSLLSC